MATYHTRPNDELIEPISGTNIYSTTPYRQRAYMSCCSSFLCFLTYILFGYICSNATLLIMLDRNCSFAINETRVHLVIDFNTVEGKKTLWFSEALSMFIFSVLATYRTCRYLHR